MLAVRVGVQQQFLLLRKVPKPLHAVEKVLADRNCGVESYLELDNSVVAFARDLYSTSVLDLDTVAYFLALQETKFGPTNIAKPL
jgi:hypothetical protein